MKMGNKNSGVQKYKINEDFFNKWSSQMAYVLGFTCADGNVHERTLSWDLSNKYDSNYDLLKYFNEAMHSNYPIIERSRSFRLRISNSKILIDIKDLGIIPNKNKVLKFPEVPDRYLSHFVRGFLDGDGWIVTRIRNNGGKEICVGFSNGSLDFMEHLVKIVKNRLGITRNNLRKRLKYTKRGKPIIYYQLEYYSDNAMKIIDYLYNNLDSMDLFLGRKYEKMKEAKEFYKEINNVKSFGKKFIEINEKFGDVFVAECFKSKKLIPREMAGKLGVSLSTLYRWMDKMNIRIMKQRGSSEWSRRITDSKSRLLRYG